MAAAARPFLHSARCDGLGAGLEGPVVSLRLLSEADDRPLTWSTSALGAGPGRKIPPDPAAFAAPFIEMFADPVFRARFEAAVHDVFMDPDAAVDFAFGGTEFSVSSEGESLVLASFIDRARISDRAPWMVQRQVADPRDRKSVG